MQSKRKAVRWTCTYPCNTYKYNYINHSETLEMYQKRCRHYLLFKTHKQTHATWFCLNSFLLKAVWSSIRIWLQQWCLSWHVNYPIMQLTIMNVATAEPALSEATAEPGPALSESQLVFETLEALCTLLILPIPLIQGSPVSCRPTWLPACVHSTSSTPYIANQSSAKWNCVLRLC